MLSRIPAALASVLTIAGVLAASSQAALPQRPLAELASIDVDGAPAGASNVVIAGGGRYVAFVSSANNLASGQALFDTNGVCDVFRRDVMTGVTDVVSRVPGGAARGANCERPIAISTDGGRVGFIAANADLVNTAAAGQSNGLDQALVHDLVSGTLLLASRFDGVSSAATPTPAVGLSLSGDGRFVAFVSASTQRADVAVPPNAEQVWLRDLTDHTTALTSASDGSATTPTGGSDPSVDHDGQRVAFAGSGPSVLVRLPGSITTTASVRTDGTPIDGGSPSLSATGNAVAFVTRATPFSPAGSATAVVVRSLTANATTLASAPAGTSTPGNADSGPPSLSAQGRVVAFASRATNLGAGAANGHAQVYVADLRRGLLTLASASTTPGAGGGNGDSAAGGEGVLTAPALADGGIDVAFQTVATDVAAPDTTSAVDAVVRRVRVQQTLPVNSTREASLDGLDGRNVGQQRTNGGSGVTDLAVSADGRWVAFTAGQDDYAGDPRGPEITYVRDRLTGEVESVSRASDAGGRPGALMTGFCSGGGYANALSEDGRYVTFCNGALVHRRDRLTGTTVVVSRANGAAGANANNSSGYVAMSRDGRYVVFASAASNLDTTRPEAGSTYRFYRRDLDAGTTVRVDLRDGTSSDAGRTVNYEGVDFLKPSISDDGSRVVFTSRDAQLEAGSGFGAGSSRQVYLRDLGTDRTFGLNRAADGTWGRRSDGGALTLSEGAVITPDGGFAVFTSDAANLVAAKTDNDNAVYRRTLTVGGGALSGALSIASVPDGPAPTTNAGQLDNGATFGAVSADGSRVLFASGATNVLASGTLLTQIYSRDLAADDTFLVSRADGAAGAPANGGQMVYAPGLSSNGAVAVFGPRSTNLDGDVGLQTKVMVRVLTTDNAIVPVNTVAPSTSPSPPRRGTPSSCAPGTWTGSPSFDYAWLRGGAEIPGATSAGYTPAAADVGQTLACRVTATTPAGSAVATSTGQTVIDAPPRLTGQARIDGDPTFDRTLTCAGVTVSGGAPVTYTWTREPPGGTEVAIAGATAATYVVAEADIGRRLRCVGTATNSGGTVVDRSSTVRGVTEITITQAPTLDGAMTTGTTASCTTGAASIRPAGFNLARTFSLERTNFGDQVIERQASPDSPQTRLLSAADENWFFHCVTTWGDPETGEVVSRAPRRSAVAPAPVPPPPPLPGPPAATAPPEVRYLGDFQRFCKAATYNGSLQGSRSVFTWTVHFLTAGRETAVSAVNLRDGLLGAGQVLSDARVARDPGASGVSCTQTITGPNGAKTVTRSAIVSPGIYCRGVGGQVTGNSGSGTPVVVLGGSGACNEVDTGTDLVVRGAPELPAPPVVVQLIGSTYTATLAVGCGATGTGGCSQTATLVVPRTVLGAGSRASAAAAKPVVIARARVKVPKGKRAAVVRLRLTKAATKKLRRAKRLPTTLRLTRNGKTKAIAAPLLTLKAVPKPKRPSGGV